MCLIETVCLNFHSYINIPTKIINMNYLKFGLDVAKRKKNIYTSNIINNGKLEYLKLFLLNNFNFHFSNNKLYIKLFKFFFFSFFFF